MGEGTIFLRSRLSHGKPERRYVASLRMPDGTRPAIACPHGTNVLPPFRRALQAAGLPRITLHDLRHSCATMMLEAGVPLPAIAEQLGHSSLRVTGDLYAHRTPAMMQDAAERLAAALS